MRHGVFANLPQQTQNAFLQAQTSILNGQFDAAALLLGRCVQDMMKHFYDHLLPDDLKQAATIIASFVYNTAQRDEKIPRKELPKARGTGGRGF